MPLTEDAAYAKDLRGAVHPKLQHRHFAFIAAVISKMPEHVKPWAVTMFENECAKCNPNFDYTRFRKACGARNVHGDET